MQHSIPRRWFLGLAAGAAGASLVGLARGRAAEPSDKYGGFRMGIQSYSLRGYEVDEALRHTHDLGLESIEFFDAHFSLKSTPDQIEAMKDKVRALGIQIMGHGVNGFTADHEANRKVFEFARRAGIRNISADPTEDAFDSLDELVARFDIRIAIHNHGPGERYDKIADVLEAVEGRHKLIGACADLGHYIRSAEDPVKAIHLLGGRLFGIHLKDFAEQKADSRGVILGQGHLDLVATFQALRKVDFPADGCLSLEYEEKPDNPLDDIRQCLEVASEAAQKSKR